ncbi:MAG: cytochrome c-type biogenesis protein CcmH [Alphaproteobacteria bacterium]|nr:cytochrome c-type biogenesis protein CcmH [Alphaproteobacteria bacterium]
MRARLSPILFAATIAAFAVTALAVEPGEVLKDPALEARARTLSSEIRCLVCQNQSIDESDADLARDMRRLVRERLAAGDSDQEIRDYLIKRYGDFVMLRPPVKRSTWLLWFGPILVLLGAAAVMIVYFRSRRRTSATAALADDERSRLDALLAEDDDAS